MIQTKNDYRVLILIKSPAFYDKKRIYTHYINPLLSFGLDAQKIGYFKLFSTDKKKVPIKLMRSFIEGFLSDLSDEVKQIPTYLYITDSEYFKELTGAIKPEHNYGYVLPIKNQPNMYGILGINTGTLFFKPQLQDRLTLGLETIYNHITGSYKELGSDIINSGSTYTQNNKELIFDALKGLYKHSLLSVDIETFGLHLNEGGLVSIAFAWDNHNGIAIECKSKEIQQALRDFFINYKGKYVFHNSTFDIKHLIFNLFMDNPLDSEGLLYGLSLFEDRYYDTKIEAYLATNSCAGNNLSLKYLAQEFTGNYALDDINDVSKVAIDKLLNYNLVDSLATMWVHEQYYPRVIQDNQEHIYRTLMLPSTLLIIHMELVGMPMNKDKIQHAKQVLKDKRDEYIKYLNEHSIIKELVNNLQLIALDKKNKSLKKKQYSLEDFSYITFNAQSDLDMRELLYTELELPVIEVTSTGLPAVNVGTLSKLINHTTNVDHIKILNTLIDLSKVDKVLTAFIPAFEQGFMKEDGTTWLHGSFNLGGTVSGRLSSSKPNLQNLPSNSEYGKLVKECFVAPKGWVFAGADFNSLEDYISALTTKDKNKLIIYLHGYDSHMFRAVQYFKDEMPDITLANIDDECYCLGVKDSDIIFKKDTLDLYKGMPYKEIPYTEYNRILLKEAQKRYKELRQRSKAPTFALTYGGTYRTLMQSCGFNETQAKIIEANYHELYQESDNYVKRKLEQAAIDGYVEVAFNLRIRTPLLKQTATTSRKPKEVASEARTVGNALGQSYGLLNNRAAIEFMIRVRNSPYKADIKPVSLIHDAIYILIKDDIDVITWVNTNLIECMQWQELPEIAHDKVKLGAALDLFYPSWANPINIPNNSTSTQIIDIVNKALNK